MFVYIARHAWAGEFGDPRWPNDALRPLTEEGIIRFGHVARHLASIGFAPVVIATSPLVRCRQTADLLAEAVNEAWGAEPEIAPLAALAPGSDLQALLDWTRRFQGEGDVCWVGHVPDVGRLSAALIGDSRAQLRFAKGACSAIRFDGQIASGLGQLNWHLTAKAIGC